MPELGSFMAAAELAASEPPRSFSSFALTPLKQEAAPEDLFPWARFAVRCASCGCDDLRVGSYVEVVPSGSSESGATPGDKRLYPPHRLKCESCGRAETIFDARSDGYDGILNGGCPYASGVGDERFTDIVCKVVVAATYNISLEELRDLAAAAGPEVKATDLFDWINIIATWPDGELELDYECA